jgi:hypothetical protein
MSERVHGGYEFVNQPLNIDLSYISPPGFVICQFRSGKKSLDATISTEYPHDLFNSGKTL